MTQVTAAGLVAFLVADTTEVDVAFFSEYGELFHGVDRQTLVITANQRLGRFLSEQWNQWQQRSGQSAWPTLPCCALQLWLQQVWDHMLVNGLPADTVKLLLNPGQQSTLWSRIVAEQLADSSILSAESLTDTAIQAWKTLRQWRKTLADLDEGFEETALLKQCVQTYQQQCAALGVMDEVARTEIIIEHIDSHFFLPVARIVLVGFDNINPLEQSLFDALQLRGVAVGHFDLALPSQCRRLGVSDSQTEIQQAARWAAALIAKRQGDQQTPPRVGIVIPDLANRRAEVQSIFNEVFEPQSILSSQPRHAPSFNTSAAQPLAQTPVMATALLALKCLGRQLDVKTLNRLLASPFLWTRGQLAQRLNLGQRLRCEYHQVALAAVVNLGEAHYTPTSPGDTEHWLSQLQAVFQLHRQWQYLTLSFAQWGEKFTEFLATLGWPGPRQLDTLEFQQVSRWPGLIELLASLDAVERQPVTWQRALSELNRIAYTPFHPQTQSSPVQILGLLEAAGMQFDYLWVMGLDYRVWPEPCKPNPLLPLAQQKRWQMPRASAERELTMAEQLTRRLSVSAYQVVMSYPLTDGDQPLRASPLLNDFDEVQAQDLNFDTAANHIQLNAPVAMAYLTDAQGPAVNDKNTVRGGTQILKNQALCPFKAFAEHRLRAQNAELFQPGITPLIRGNLIHKSLEIIWRQLRNQEALLALRDEPCVELIASSVMAAWNGLEISKTIGLQVQNLERQRTAELLGQWLAVEKQRQPFVVEFQEKAIAYDLDGLQLNLRYDRTDRLLGSDQHMVIDYKTGQTDIKKWFGERPDEPQVPLYALIDRQWVVAAAFAQINRQEVALKGVCADAIDGLVIVDELEKWAMPTSWEGLLDHWQRTLSNLARSFFAGQAQVDPKQKPMTCNFCQLHNVCRIDGIDGIDDREQGPQGDAGDH